MGVPGLSKALKPYSTPNIVGCKNVECYQHRLQNDSKRAIIVDGPSFAYCIYRKITTQKPDWLRAIDTVPTYEELGIGAIAFLDELRYYGLVM